MSDVKYVLIKGREHLMGGKERRIWSLLASAEIVIPTFIEWLLSYPLGCPSFGQCDSTESIRTRGGLRSLAEQMLGGCGLISIILTKTYLFPLWADDKKNEFLISLIDMQSIDIGYKHMKSSRADRERLARKFPLIQLVTVFFLLLQNLKRVMRQKFANCLAHKSHKSHLVDYITMENPLSATFSNNTLLSNTEMDQFIPKELQLPVAVAVCKLIDCLTCDQNFVSLPISFY